MKKAKLLMLIGAISAIVSISGFLFLRSNGVLAGPSDEDSSSSTQPQAGVKSGSDTTQGVVASANREQLRVTGEGYSTDFSNTLRGYVSNSYNVRNDILKYIDEKYKDPTLRDSFIKYAVAQQDFIERGSTREAAIYQADQISRVNACLFQQLGPDRYEEKGVILAMAINTEARFKAYWKAVDLQSNRVTVRPQGDPCGK
ncbi:hypothetical protein [Burkholderia gladioli]|uniref:hypothetical protein n=1 Tax=Burkholderia gladioli TaxID=28095 RepID=UPI0012D95DEE|nr:hypothetical protein [Burkholderia gladioli]